MVEEMLNAKLDAESGLLCRATRVSRDTESREHNLARFGTQKSIVLIV